MLDEAEEGADGGESGVAAPRAVTSLGLEILQEPEDQGSVDVFELKLRRLDAQPSRREHEEHLERVRVAIARVLAGTTFEGKSLSQEGADVRRDGGHGAPPRKTLSVDDATRARRSGVTSRYQYDEEMLT